MYHRIAEPEVDPWGLSVPVALFQDQLDALRSRRRPMSMDELVEALEQDRLPRDAVAITFDDGYADNAVVAKPLLEKGGLPATFFLSTGSLDNGEPFWWDELAHMVVRYPHSTQFRIEIGDEALAIALPPIANDGIPRSEWRVDKGAASRREEGYVKLWTCLQRVAATERAQHMTVLRHIFGRAEMMPQDLPMSWDQAKALSSDLITVGAHAQNHQPLTAQTPARRRAEIRGSREDCLRKLGHVPTGFAFPHGDRDADVIAAVREAGFLWSCSTVGRAISVGRDDKFDLPRVAVGRWSGSELIRIIERLR
jgi:peptidoglycan/xylan/chitin deacetylase (PgdA/CDA1 family)